MIRVERQPVDEQLEEVFVLNSQGLDRQMMTANDQIQFGAFGPRELHKIRLQALSKLFASLFQLAVFIKGFSRSGWAKLGGVDNAFDKERPLRH